MSEPRYHWLVAGNVICSSSRGVSRQRGLNTIVTTPTPKFTKVDIAKAQDSLMRRFVTETEQEKGSKISDVFLLSISNLGLQTHEEFESSFTAMVPVEEAPAAAELH